MLSKRILDAGRVRRITGGFSFIPHRFLADGFLASLEREEILLYLFLILAADRHGLSCYSYDAICTLLQINLDEYIAARDGLIGRDLIGFDGRTFQVLALPAHPVARPKPAREDAATVGRLIRESLREADQRRIEP
jgi:hypothetical protein